MHACIVDIMGFDCRCSHMVRVDHTNNFSPIGYAASSLEQVLPHDYLTQMSLPQHPH